MARGFEPGERLRSVIRPISLEVEELLTAAALSGHFLALVAREIDPRARYEGSDPGYQILRR
jgi:hypothetical protein